MKNRMYSYGYGIVNEKPAIIPEEATVVERIFSEYIAGKVLKSIAADLTAEKVVYFCDRTSWNKNMICRMIENRKYIGEDNYPRIISDEMFEKANSIKDSKDSRQPEDTSENAFLRKVVFCKQCGKRLGRKSKWKRKEKWFCNNGCQCKKYIDDSTLYSGIRSVLKKVSVCPDLLTQVVVPIQYQKTQEIMRYNNEISRAMNSGNPSFATVKKLIMECASLKFSACNENRLEAYTDFLLKKTKGISLDKAVDIDYLRDVLKRIEIDQEGNIILCFINGAEISDQEERTNASGYAENSNENRSQPVAV